MILDKLGRGPKSGIAAAIESGKLDAGDFVITNGTDGEELVLIERDKSQVVIKSRTQNDISVMGVNLSTEVADGKTIPAGTDLDTFIRKLVQKRIAASYTAPTIAIANNGGQAATVVEAGSTVTLKVKSTFTQNDAGAITKHAITVAGTEKATGTNAELTHEESLVIGDGATNVVSSVAYEAGAVKKDNFGDDSPSGKIEAGTKESSKYTITGARKAFWGSVSGDLPTLNSATIRGLGNEKLNPAANNVLALTVAEGDKHIIVSVPSTRSIKQITYVDLGDKGMLSKFTQSTVAVEGAGGAGVSANQSKTYVYSMASPAAAAMNFEFLLA